MNNNSSFSVISVTYNSQSTIRDFLKSVNENSNANEIIVVDNNSKDKSVEEIQKFKNVKLLKLDKNLGFSKANNIAANIAKGEYLIFLNPDSRILEKNTIEKLILDIENHPEFGLVGPKFIYPDKSLQLTVRNFPTITNAVNEYWLNKKGEYDFYEVKEKGLTSVETIVGACMVIKKDTYTKIGGFNEKFFLYFEDIYLCKKIKELNLLVGYDPNVVFLHHVGESSKHNKQVSKLLIDSAKRYHGLLKYYLLYFIIRISQIIK